MHIYISTELRGINLTLKGNQQPTMSLREHTPTSWNSRLQTQMAVHPAAPDVIQLWCWGGINTSSPS